MFRHPTPIADELRRLGMLLVTRVAAKAPLDAAELQGVADDLDALARRAAPVERFHAELVAEAAEEELRQSSGGVPCEGARRG